MTATPPASASSKSANHSQWIDFLRGASALAVVLFHVRVDLWVGWNAIHAQPESYSAFDRAASWLSLFTPLFGSAVMLFFLVSGFCVHFAYAANGRPFELESYTKRRFFRIYPPYIAIVLLGILVERSLVVLSNEPGSSLMTVLKTVFMVQNYGAQAGQMSSNPSLWSLPVEAELYIVYPLFLWGCLRFGYKAAIGAVALCSAAALVLSLFFVWDGFFHPSTNFIIFWIIWCGGAGLAEAFKRGTLPDWKRWHGALMLILLLLASVATLKLVPIGVVHLLWGAFYFLLMLWGLAKPDLLNVVSPRWKQPILSIGVFSYALYLLHFPFFHLCGAIWVQLFGSKPTNFLVSLCFVALTLPLAALFYRLIELPSHTWARRFGSPRSKRLAPSQPR